MKGVNSFVSFFPPMNFSENGSVGAGSSFEGIRNCILDMVKPSCCTEEVSHGHLAMQVWSSGEGAVLETTEG